MSDFADQFLIEIGRSSFLFSFVDCSGFLEGAGLTAALGILRLEVKALGSHHLPAAASSRHSRKRYQATAGKIVLLPGVFQKIRFWSNSVYS